MSFASLDPYTSPRPDSLASDTQGWWRTRGRGKNTREEQRRLIYPPGPSPSHVTDHRRHFARSRDPPVRQNPYIPSSCQTNRHRISTPLAPLSLASYTQQNLNPSGSSQNTHHTHLEDASFYIICSNSCAEEPGARALHRRTHAPSHWRWSLPRGTYLTARITNYNIHVYWRSIKRAQSEPIAMKTRSGGHRRLGRSHDLTTRNGGYTLPMQPLGAPRARRLSIPITLHDKRRHTTTDDYTDLRTTFASQVGPRDAQEISKRGSGLTHALVRPRSDSPRTSDQRGLTVGSGCHTGIIRLSRRADGERKAGGKKKKKKGMRH